MVSIEITESPDVTAPADLSEPTEVAIAPTDTESLSPTPANSEQDNAPSSDDGGNVDPTATDDSWDLPWYFPVTGGGILAFVIGLLIYGFWPHADLRPRCNNCGYILEGTDVSCPQCGETRRNTGLKQ